MRVFVAGQRSFGAAVLDLVIRLGHEVVGVTSPVMAPDRDWPDLLRVAAQRAGVGWMPSGILCAETLPARTDLIITAHSHDFIGRRTRLKSKLGGIGYHPSLLPLHRGRDAIEWAIRMRERVTGGTVYWLSDGVDAGDVAAQRHVFIAPDDDARSLWRRELFPLGLSLFERVLTDVAAGRLVRVPQRHALATWEPSLGRQPIFRPELPQLGIIDGFDVIRAESACRS